MTHAYFIVNSALHKNFLINYSKFIGKVGGKVTSKVYWSYASLFGDEI